MIVTVKGRRYCTLWVFIF